MSDTTKAIKVLELIAATMEADVEEFEGKPFDGQTVGELHGRLAAAITALADTLKDILESGNEQPGS
jgi:hypothetical protein